MRFRFTAYVLDEGLVRGQVEARNQSGARAEVFRLGYKPLKITPASGFLSRQKFLPAVSQVTTSDLVRFCHQLATMLGSGSTLMRTLALLQSEHKSREMGRILRSISRTLDEGGSLTAALAEHTGHLAPALEQMAELMEKQHEAKQKAIKALMYPMAIVSLSLVTLGVLMTVAMPPILKVFERMDTEIPLMTRVTVATIGGLNDNFQTIFLGTFAFAGFLLVSSRIPKVRVWLDTAKARAPLIGSLVVAGELSQFSRTLAMLLEAGVPLSSALQLGMSGCKNQCVRKAFQDAEDSLISGHGLAPALRRHRVLPSMFVELVLLGEEGNSLERTFRDSGEAYQKQLERRLDGLLGMLEPASTVMVGGVVGLIAFSMFVPIYSGLSAGP